MLAEDIMELVEIEQKFHHGIPYNNFSELYLDLQIYLEYREPYLKHLAPMKDSMNGIYCTLTKLVNLTQSIENTPGSDIVRKQVLGEVNTKICEVEKIKEKMRERINEYKREKL